jgi:hypothetical protein
MNAATLTTIREKHNQGSDGDHVFLLACELGHHGESPRLAFTIAADEAFANGETLGMPLADAHIADRLVELINITDCAAVAS